MTWRSIPLAAVALVASATGVSAQSVRGTVVERATGAPLSGVVVQLLDSAGHGLMMGRDAAITGDSWWPASVWLTANSGEPSARSAVRRRATMLSGQRTDDRGATGRQPGCRSPTAAGRARRVSDEDF